MGNNSSLANYDIDENSGTQCGNWTLLTAAEKDSENRVSVLRANLKNYGQLPKDLERGIESLKKLRHPNVLRYVHSEVAGEHAYLFVEPVKPLSQVLNSLSELEICSGLHNILSAIDFIHSKASTAHNNISKACVFVAEDGQWKLGAFDLSCSFSDVTYEYLDQIRSRCYDKAVPPEDESKLKQKKENASARDLYGYGQLVKEIVDSNIPHARDFAEIAGKQLQNTNPDLRGSTRALLAHKFFQQDLLRIDEFFKNIAVKSLAETELFFRTLPDLLRSLPEDIVGAKLSAVLLSRIVVLNPTAQSFLLPKLLVPRNYDSDDASEIFSVGNYRTFILPKISRIFFVRDLQVRLVLLHYFPYYFKLLDEAFLRGELLPELLLGIRDTNNELVAATLRVLADLVVLFGAGIIVGGKREKLFADGRPKFTEDSVVVRVSEKPKMLKATPLIVAQLPAMEETPLPERHAPDGGEDVEEVAVRDEDGLANSSDTAADWSDWEATDTLSVPEPLPVSETPTARASSTSGTNTKVDVFDLSSLEIQVKPKEEEFDFFADMQPKITPQTSVPLAQVAVKNTVSFAAVAVDEQDADGWNWDD